MESNSEKEEIFFFQKLQEDFPKIFSLINFDDLPLDEQNVRYSNWKDVYNNMLEREKDKFFKNLPRDIFNLLILSIPFEEILDFLKKICSHKPSYCDERQDFWILLWKRDVNNNPPPFGVKEKYLAFVYEFNKEIDIQKKFYLAIEFGAIDLIIDLINRIDISADNYNALRLAATYGHLEIIRLLANLDPKGIKANNYYVRGTAGYEFPALFSAVKYGHLEIVHILVDLDPEGIKAHNYEALRQAAEYGHLEIVRLLVDLGPEGIKADNYSPLRWAVANGHLEVVRFLVDLDPEGIKVDNYQVLRLAARFGHLEVVRFLTDLHPEGIKVYNYDALRSAAENGHLEVVYFLSDLDPEGIKANNYEALYLAAENGHLEVVRFLADLNPEGIKVNDYEVLYFIAKRGHLEMVQFLLSKIENISEIPDNIKILIKNKFNFFI